MKQVEISIIIPVYNSEKYIHNCLDSIGTQSFKKYEVIIIDDGSTDDSLHIVNNYKEKFDNMYVYTKSNSGPSEARNFGVQKAKGKYITFIDSDDCIHHDYLLELYEAKMEYDVEISVVQMERIWNKDVDLSLKRESNKSVEILTKKEALCNMFYQKTIDTSPCGLLIDKQIVEKNPFPVGRYHEDDFTIYKYILCVSKIALVKRVLYYYIQRDNSIMHTNGKVNYDELDAANYLVEEFSNDYMLYKAAYSKKFSNFCQVLLKCPELKTEDQCTYFKIVEFLKEARVRILVDHNTRPKNKLAALLLLFGVKFFSSISKLFYR